MRNLRWLSFRNPAGLPSGANKLYSLTLWDCMTEGSFGWHLLSLGGFIVRVHSVLHVHINLAARNFLIIISRCGSFTFFPAHNNLRVMRHVRLWLDIQLG